MNILRNEHDLSTNPEVQYFLSIFYLIAHYDSGHHEILPYLVQSFQRFLLKKSHISKEEIVMMDLLKKLPQSDKEKKPVEAFSTVKKELENIPIDKMHYYIFRYFDIVSWLESKIKNKSFQEIIREKIK